MTADTSFIGKVLEELIASKRMDVINITAVRQIRR
jgi:hypothetical protein